MNKGVFGNNQSDGRYENGEVIFSASKPSIEKWIRLNGSIYDINTKIDNKYDSQRIKNIYKNFASFRSFSWTTRTSTFGSYGSLLNVEFGNDIWLINSQNQISVSTDTLTWVSRNPDSFNITPIKYGNGLWVLGASSGTIKTSTDTISWVSRQSNITSSAMQGLAYGDNTWVIGNGSGQVASSTDAITWTSRNANLASEHISTIAYGAGTWVIGGYNGAIRTSTDTITWVTRTSNFGTTTIRSIAYNNGLWVAAGKTGFRYSTDAATWVTATPNMASQRMIYSIHVNDGFWGAFGSYGSVYTSTDAITWVTRTTIPEFADNSTAGIRSAKFANNKTMIVSNNGLVRVSAPTVELSTVGRFPLNGWLRA